MGWGVNRAVASSESPHLAPCAKCERGVSGGGPCARPALCCATSRLASIASSSSLIAMTSTGGTAGRSCSCEVLVLARAGALVLVLELAGGLASGRASCTHTLLH